MNYTISINQLACTDLGMTLNEAVVLDAIRQMLASSSVLEFIHQQKCYKWIAPSKIIDALPILGLQKRSIMDIIKSLEEKGLIERCPDNQKLAKAYYRAGVNFDKAFSKPMQKNAQVESDLCKNLHTTYAEPCTPPMQNSAHYYNTNNSNTKINIERAPEIEKDACLLAVEESRKRLTTTQNVQAPFESDKCKQLWADWQEHLKEKGKSPSRVTLEKHCRDLRMHPESAANAMIEQAIAKGWCSIYPLDKKEESPKGQQRKNGAHSEIRGRMGSNFD